MMAEDRPDPQAEDQTLRSGEQEAPMDAEGSDRAPVVALVIWLCGFFLLLAFLLWDSLVQVVRWFAG